MRTGRLLREAHSVPGAGWEIFGTRDKLRIVMLHDPEPMRSSPAGTWLVRMFAESSLRKFYGYDDPIEAGRKFSELVGGCDAVEIDVLAVRHPDDVIDQRSDTPVEDDHGGDYERQPARNDDHENAGTADFFRERGIHE